jgi:hypothetical protein
VPSARIAAVGRRWTAAEVERLRELVMECLGSDRRADVLQETLAGFRTVEMGLPPAPAEDADASAAIVEWYRTCEERQDRG